MRESLLILCLLVGSSCCKHKPVGLLPRNSNQQVDTGTEKAEDIWFRYQYDEHERNVVRLSDELHDLLWRGTMTLTSNNFSIVISFTVTSTNRVPMLGVLTGSVLQAAEFTIEAFEETYPSEIAFVNHALRRKFSDYQALGDFDLSDVLHLFYVQSLLESKQMPPKTPFFQDWQPPDHLGTLTAKPSVPRVYSGHGLTLDNEQEGRTERMDGRP